MKITGGRGPYNGRDNGRGKGGKDIQKERPGKNFPGLSVGSDLLRWGWPRAAYDSFEASASPSSPAAALVVAGNGSAVVAPALHLLVLVVSHVVDRHLFHRMAAQVGVDFGLVLVLEVGEHAEHDLLLLLVELDDLQGQLLVDLEGLPRRLQILDSELRQRHESIDVLVEPDDHAALENPRNLSGRRSSHGVQLGQLRPRILQGHLVAERDPPPLLVDLGDDHRDHVSFLEHFAGLADPPGPGHVGDVDEAVDCPLRFRRRAPKLVRLLTMPSRRLPGG